MGIESFPPGLILILGAFFLPALKGTPRAVGVLVLPLLTLAAVVTIPTGVHLELGFLGFELEPLRVTTLGRLFAIVFSLMAAAGGLYGLRQASLFEIVSAYVYAGSAVGATFAGDLITLFVFWELMAIGSTAVIWSAGTEPAYRAGVRYLLVHLLGGVLLMLGVTGYAAANQSVAFGPMELDGPATWLIFAGFLVNAGAPPLSAWIADAYPEASPSGAAFLSAFTTKTAVYALLVGFAGTSLLVPIGLYMAFYGIIYALLENDMRRILAYSIVNQVGFMVAGIGIGTPMALNGAAAHAFAHIIYKGLLFMSAGAVLYRTGKRKCTELGGLFRTMPFTMAFGAIGAIAISSFPFTSGFVSKSMINQAAADADLAVSWFLLTAASAGVFLHAGIKFPWFVFFHKDSGMRPPEAPGHMMISMGFFAFLCLFLGVAPGVLYSLLPLPVEYVPYTVEHLVSQFQLLLFAGLAFFALLPAMLRTETLSLDFDWLYRRLGWVIVAGMASSMSAGWSALGEGARGHFGRITSVIFRTHGPQGPLARSWPVGSMVLWVAVLLGAFLAFALS